MTIRRSTRDDLHCLMAVYREARQIQLDSGNLYQWKDGYPSEEAGFRYCGVIHLLSGDLRLAYQKIQL